MFRLLPHLVGRAETLQHPAQETIKTTTRSAIAVGPEYRDETRAADRAVCCAVCARGKCARYAAYCGRARTAERTPTLPVAVEFLAASATDAQLGSGLRGRSAQPRARRVRTVGSQFELRRRATPPSRACGGEARSEGRHRLQACALSSHSVTRGSKVERKWAAGLAARPRPLTRSAGLPAPQRGSSSPTRRRRGFPRAGDLGTNERAHSARSQRPRPDCEC